ncbi:hypothetical protein HMPREF1358_02168, partial [Enterococcus faecium C621]
KAKGQAPFFDAYPRIRLVLFSFLGSFPFDSVQFLSSFFFLFSLICTVQHR